MNLNEIYKRYAYKWILERLNQDKTMIPKERNPSINKMLFMATNGGGLGHLTRALAIAKRIRKIYPDVEIIFATTSSALEIIIEDGFLAYPLSLDNSRSNNLSQNKDNYLEKQLLEIISKHNIDTFVFDGVFPYHSIINTFKKSINLNTVWIQRGMHKSGKSEIIRSREKYFKRIIVPGEVNLNDNLLHHNNNYYYCPPIIYSEKDELLPRDKVLKMWNLDLNKRTVFIKGPNNDGEELISEILKALKDKNNLQIVLTESIIARKRLDMDSNVFVLKGYPISIYFNAFDFAIITGSYNTFHETMYFGVPTIIFPSKTTKTDDQVARARIAQSLGTGFLLVDFDETRFNEAVCQLLTPSVNERMRQKTKDLFNNGAEIAARYIMES